MPVNADWIKKYGDEKARPSEKYSMNQSSSEIASVKEV